VTHTTSAVINHTIHFCCRCCKSTFNHFNIPSSKNYHFE